MLPVSEAVAVAVAVTVAVAVAVTVAVAVAVALLHADCIGSRLDGAAVPQELPLAATTLFAAGLTRVQEALRAASSRGWRVDKPRLAASDVACVVVFAPHHWNLAARICTPRPPPVWAAIS